MASDLVLHCLPIVMSHKKDTRLICNFVNLICGSDTSLY